MTASRHDSTEGRHAVKSDPVTRPAVTAETLTDAMIRSERARAAMASDDEAVDDATIAIGNGKCVYASVPGGRRYPTATEIHEARARIAAAINARGGK